MGLQPEYNISSMQECIEKASVASFGKPRTISTSSMPKAITCHSLAGITSTPATSASTYSRHYLLETEPEPIRSTLCRDFVVSLSLCLWPLIVLVALTMVYGAPPAAFDPLPQISSVIIPSHLGTKQTLALLSQLSHHTATLIYDIGTVDLTELLKSPQLQSIIIVQPPWMDPQLFNRIVSVLSAIRYTCVLV